jgi:hypothetical protein
MPDDRVTRPLRRMIQAKRRLRADGVRIDTWADHDRLIGAHGHAALAELGVFRSGFKSYGRRLRAAAGWHLPRRAQRTTRRPRHRRTRARARAPGRQADDPDLANLRRHRRSRRR